MALRLGEYVEGGWIDNRVRGRVKAEIHIKGHAAKLHLNLAGNAWQDLAGTLIEFTCTSARPATDAALEGLEFQQEGTVGDITASRKVKVPQGWPEIPVSKLTASTQVEWQNSLYLEWFSDINGRVVIEAVNCRWNISTPEWRMSADEEALQREENEQTLKEFVEHLTEAFHEENQELQRREQEVLSKYPEDLDEDMSEEDWERLLKTNDQRFDRITEIEEALGDKIDIREILNILYPHLSEAQDAEIEIPGLLSDDAVVQDERLPFEELEETSGAGNPVCERLLEAAERLSQLIFDAPVRGYLEAEDLANEVLRTDLLQSIIKVRTLAELAADLHLTKGHLLALAKRELARINRILPALQMPDEVPSPLLGDLSAAVHQVRNDLVNLRQWLRSR